MPVILKPEDEQSWLSENNEELLKKLLVPFDPNKMAAYAISKEVNSPKNNKPGIIIPV